MKKFFTVFLIGCAFACMLTACAADENFGNENRQNADVERRAPVSFCSYVEYQAYIEKGNSPSQMVTYEELKQLGNFRSFSFLSDVEHRDYSRYRYVFVDENGVDVILDVSPAGYQDSVQWEWDWLSDADINPSNMRMCKSDKERGKYIYHGVEYDYLSGKLFRVVWRNKRLCYSILAGTSYSEYPGYPMKKNSFALKLLDRDQAKQALESLPDK